MITVIHERRGSRYTEKPEVAFGFSGRAAYTLGRDRPNYPVPAIPLEAKWYSKELTKDRSLCTINRKYSVKWCTYTGWWGE